MTTDELAQKQSANGQEKSRPQVLGGEEEAKKKPA